jgi:3-oxoacyl-[acyl-carrier protein] reductase
LLDAAEAALGPVEILVCNASGWVQDTFTPATQDHFGRPMRALSSDTFESQFAVDARSTALMIAEFARRHIAREADWGRIVSLTSGGPDGFPSEVSYGAAKAALENFTMSAAWELGRFGITANVVLRRAGFHGRAPCWRSKRSCWAAEPSERTSHRSVKTSST